MCLSINFTFAQQGDTLSVQRNLKGKISFASFKANGSMQMKQGGKFLKEALKMNNNDSLRLTKESTDNLGITHQRYQQYYKGIRIEGGEYLLHGRNDSIKTMNGNFEAIDISSVIPKLTEQQSLSKALQFVNAEKYL